MIITKNIFLAFLQVILLIMLGSSERNGIKCLHRESQALLKFKTELIVDKGRLSSWENENDCCQWEGILCDNRTNHVIALNLRSRNIGGRIPDALKNLSSLSDLDLSGNHLEGPIPDFLGNLTSLSYLDLSNNTIEGVIPKSVGNLFSLSYLVLSNNQLRGVISEAHLFNLSSLQLLDLGFNSNLTLRIDPFWNPPFQLQSLSLANCNVGPHFPSRWLQSQRNISSLDISNASISDTIPNWFWIPIFVTLNMSHNQIHGTLPDLSSQAFMSLDLSFNQFNGSIPPIPRDVVDINLSMNKFSSITSCNYFQVYTLDFSDNLLSGHISPGCFKNMTSLGYLNLANNNLSGQIQIDNSSCLLYSLYLNNNSFTGYIPWFLKTCDKMVVLDLGENNFYGNIPEWLGASMPELVAISLKSNKLNGTLPSSLCKLSKIQILDISMNRISDTIPRCVKSFTTMSSKSHRENLYSPPLYKSTSISWSISHNSATITWKGRVYEYIDSNLWLLKVIDLSSNNFSGEIPHEVMSLVGLYGLNLSRNNLGGTIPSDISQLELLNFLDLSRNNLTGNIPSTFSQLSHLGMLDLSFNNLSGRIPNDTHMDTFNATSFIGNPGLCGGPLLSKPCPKFDEMPEKPKFSDKKEHILKNREFYISMVLGFIISFWGVFGTLFLSKRWNVAIVKMFVRAEDWLYVKFHINRRCVQRYFQT